MYLTLHQRIAGSPGSLGHVRDRECRQRTGHQLLRRHAMHPISSHRSQGRLLLSHPPDIRQSIKQPAPATAAQDYIAGYCGRSYSSSRHCRLSVRALFCAIFGGEYITSNLKYACLGQRQQWYCFNVAVTPRCSRLTTGFWLIDAAIWAHVLQL